MYKIINKRDLTKAEFHRECICCGKDTPSVQKIEFFEDAETPTQKTTIWICKACLNEVNKHFITR